MWRSLSALVLSTMVAGCREAPSPAPETSPPETSPPAASAPEAPHELSGTWSEAGRRIYVMALGDRAIVTYHDAFWELPGLRNCACSWFGRLEGDVIVAEDEHNPPLRASVEGGALKLEPASGLARCCYAADDEDFSPGASSTAGPPRVVPAACMTSEPARIFGAEGEREIPSGTWIWSMPDEEAGTYAAAAVGDSAIVGKGRRGVCAPR